MVWVRRVPDTGTLVSLYLLCTYIPWIEFKYRIRWSDEKRLLKSLARVAASSTFFSASSRSASFSPSSSPSSYSYSFSFLYYYYSYILVIIFELLSVGAALMKRNRCCPVFTGGWDNLMEKIRDYKNTWVRVAWRGTPWPRGTKRILEIPRLVLQTDATQQHPQYPDDDQP